MISMAATNSLTEAPTFVKWTTAVPQMGTAAVIADVPWLYSALTQVREIEKEGQQIRGLGDLRVAVQTAKCARILLSSIDIHGLPSPVVAPISGGGLSVAWSLGAKEVKLSVAPGGDAISFKLLDDEIVDEAPLAAMTPSPVVGQLEWMLEPGN